MVRLGTLADLSAEDSQSSWSPIIQQYATLWFNNCGNVGYLMAVAYQERDASNQVLAQWVEYECVPPNTVGVIGYEHVSPDGTTRLIIGYSGSGTC